MLGLCEYESQKPYFTHRTIDNAVMLIYDRLYYAVWKRLLKIYFFPLIHNTLHSHRNDAFKNSINETNCIYLDEELFEVLYHQFITHQS